MQIGWTDPERFHLDELAWLDPSVARLSDLIDIAFGDTERLELDERTGRQVDVACPAHAFDVFGVDSERLVDLFADTSGGPNVLKARGKALADEMAGAYTGPVAFDIDSMRKDLQAMIDEGVSLGYGMPITSQALACFDRLASAGLGSMDSVVVPVRIARK